MRRLLGWLLWPLRQFVAWATPEAHFARRMADDDARPMTTADFPVYWGEFVYRQELERMRREAQRREDVESELQRDPRPDALLGVAPAETCDERVPGSGHLCIDCRSRHEAFCDLALGHEGAHAAVDW